MVENRMAGQVTGAVVQVGSVGGSIYLGEVNLHTGAPVRTRYRSIVERIAPAKLVDRDAELADLADFATTEDVAGSYRRWCAGPWAGKTALMSWFALHPPQGVRVVSFFVTARLAGQADRAAFVDNILEQLLTLLGEQPPALLTPATREAHLAGFLDEAAHVCRERGERLVLLVDGLDEDRGVILDPDSLSIAALLPPRPMAGMRVLVSGRPAPPIPGDVDPHHPLRDPCFVRVLSPSPQAQILRKEMERDLQRLLIGPDLGRDLLALLTASGGGLTAEDLAFLADTDTWLVRQHLDTVSGRSFAQRADSLTSDGGCPVYLLGHEELHATAVDMVGEKRLAFCRERLHVWAWRYHELGWPADSPVYLLQGYHTLLLTTGDLTRASALSTDILRHQRLLAVTGADTAALKQITATIDHQAGRVPPDLVCLARLAIHRDHLAELNFFIPAAIPIAWATSGHHGRALTLAYAITDGGERAEALLGVASALVRHGHLDQGLSMIRSATDSDSFSRGNVQYRFVQVLVEKGYFDHGISVARSVTDPYLRVLALSVVAAALKATDKTTSVVDEALTAARSIIEPLKQARALRTVAATAATTKHVDRIEPTGDEALAAARSIIEPNRRAEEIAWTAVTLARIGHAGTAAQAVEEALAATFSITDPFGRDKTAGETAKAIAVAGYFDQALTAARSITKPRDQTRVLCRLAIVLARKGDPDRATAVLDEALASTHSITESGSQADALSTVAAGFAEIGRMELAARTAEDALAVARVATDDFWQNDNILSSTAVTFAQVGHFDQALTAARSITKPEVQARVLCRLAIILARKGDPDRATAVLDEALALTHSITEPSWRTSAIGYVAKVLTHLGDADQVAPMLDQALAAARSITSPTWRADKLCALAKALVRSGQADRAAPILGQALIATRSEHRINLRATLTRDAAVVLAEIGEVDQAAQALIETRLAADSCHINLSFKSLALRDVSNGLARIGLFDEALATAGSIPVPDFQAEALVRQPHSVIWVGVS